MFHLLLWILAVLIGIWGVVTLTRGQILAGIALIVLRIPCRSRRRQRVQLTNFRGKSFSD